MKKRIFEYLWDQIRALSLAKKILLPAEIIIIVCMIFEKHLSEDLVFLFIYLA